MNPRSPSDHAPASKYRNKRNVLLIAPVGEGVGGMIASANLIVAEIRRQGIVDLQIIDSTQRYRDCCDLNFFRRVWGGSWQAAKIVFCLFVSMLRYRPDCVSIWSSASLGLLRDIPLCAIAQFLGAKTHVSFHFGRIPDLAIERNWEWRLLRLVIHFGTVVTVLDRRSLAVLTDKFPDRSICQLPNAVDLDRIDKIRDRACSKRTDKARTQLAFLGMGLKSKGVVELVDACSMIRDEDFSLELVGPVGAKMKAQLSAAAAQRDEGRWLKFSGEVSNEEALERIARADILVLPSYSEGFPRSVLEAMALGLAVVATSVGAIPEMLLGMDGEPAGILVPPQDTKGLKLAIESLLRNPAKRIELGLAARRKCRASYQISSHAQKVACELWADT